MRCSAVGEASWCVLGGLGRWVLGCVDLVFDGHLLSLAVQALGIIPNPGFACAGSKKAN
jgi:hypothetical protein